MSALTDLEKKYKDMESSLRGQIHKYLQEFVRTQYYYSKECKNLNRRVWYLNEKIKKLEKALEDAGVTC